MHTIDLRLPFLKDPLIWALLLTCSVARGQNPGNATATGYPPNAVFHGTEIESVQATNGNLHIEIPIWSAKGRGIDTSGAYVYDSKAWLFNNHCFSSGICEDLVTAEPNSNMTITAHGPLDYRVSHTGSSCIVGGQTIGLTTNVVLQEPNGTKHHFAPDPVIASGT